MVNLDMDDRLQLITLLKNIPELQTERWRNARRRHRVYKFWNYLVWDS